MKFLVNRLVENVEKMKGIYLGAYTAVHPDYDIVYQDINGKRDIPGNMMDIDLSEYDFVIATPPCNYYSRESGNRHSKYAEDTAHLLPDIIEKLRTQKKIFIVENVRNDKKFRDLGLFDYDDVYVFRIGRHTIWSSIWFYHWIPYEYEFESYCDVGGNRHCRDRDNHKKRNRQGSDNVHLIVETWLKEVKKIFC